MEREFLKVLPVVKAYPEPSASYGNTVCVAGVTIPEGRWVRLYPIPFTKLPRSQRFKKYQPIEVTAFKSSKDSRPESYRVEEGSIKVAEDAVDTKHGWSERKRLLANAPFVSLCDLQRAQKAEGASLGMIRVRQITGFGIVQADEGKREKAQRGHNYYADADLFNAATLRIESLDFKFQYRFLCADDSCKGHRCSIIDWEAYELYRKMRNKDESTAQEMVEKKYVGELCGANKETYFFMGNMQKHPGSFLVLGVFYPPLTGSPTLFELKEGRRSRPRDNEPDDLNTGQRSLMDLED